MLPLLRDPNSLRILEVNRLPDFGRDWIGEEWYEFRMHFARSKLYLP